MVLGGRSGGDGAGEQKPMNCCTHIVFELLSRIIDVFIMNYIYTSGPHGRIEFTHMEERAELYTRVNIREVKHLNKENVLYMNKVTTNINSHNFGHGTDLSLYYVTCGRRYGHYGMERIVKK